MPPLPSGHPLRRWRKPHSALPPHPPKPGPTMHIPMCRTSHMARNSNIMTDLSDHSPCKNVDVSLHMPICHITLISCYVVFTERTYESSGNIN